MSQNLLVLNIWLNVFVQLFHDRLYRPILEGYINRPVISMAENRPERTLESLYHSKVIKSGRQACGEQARS